MAQEHDYTGKCPACGSELAVTSMISWFRGTAPEPIVSEEATCVECGTEYEVLSQLEDAEDVECPTCGSTDAERLGDLELDRSEGAAVEVMCCEDCETIWDECLYPVRRWVFKR